MLLCDLLRTMEQNSWVSFVENDSLPLFVMFTLKGIARGWQPVLCNLAPLNVVSPNVGMTKLRF